MVSKTAEKREARAEERESYLKTETPAEPSQEALEAKAKEQVAVVEAIALLARVVPSWPRAERRGLARALRQKGRRSVGTR